MNELLGADRDTVPSPQEIISTWSVKCAGTVEVPNKVNAEKLQIAKLYRLLWVGASDQEVFGRERRRDIGRVMPWLKADICTETCGLQGVDGGSSGRYLDSRAAIKNRGSTNRQAGEGAEQVVDERQCLVGSCHAS